MYKNVLLLLSFNFLFSQLFFSEYAEGSSNHKYLEIYNATDQEIDLSGYAFPNATNGANTEGTYDYWNDFDAGSVISANDVFVICHPSADANGIQPFCNQTHTYLSNGDDGFCLVEGSESSFTKLDCIGTWSATDPGDGWDVAGVTNGTKDHTLVRKASVLSGNAGDWSLSSGTDEFNSEWIVYEQNTWDYLGSHTIDSSGNIYGCMDMNACNYNPDATADNGTCATEDCAGECGGSAVIDDCGVCGGENATLDCEGVCDGSAVEDDCGVCNGDGTGCEGQVIFFSEYAEGSSNNKYLEIYNGMGAGIDLSNYSLSSCSNGCNDGVSWDYPDNVTFDSGTILSAGDVYVVCHGSADALIQAECDQTFTYLSNGNDAFALTELSTGTILDIIGEVGDNPGDGWNVAGVENATKDHTLVRKSTVLSGNSGNWSLSAGTNETDSEWLVYEQNTWDYVGSHTIDNSGNIYGCMDVNACNYNPDATADNGTCASEDCAGECAGSAVIDDCGVCGGENATLDCENVCGGSAIEDDCGLCVGGNTGQEPCVLEETSMLDIITNCSANLGSSIDCDGQYDLSASSASECPLYEQSVITSGVIVDYFDITPWNGPHSFTLEDADGNNLDFVVWPTSSQYQDGFDITATALNVLTQEPFGIYEVQITGELGAYCDDDQQLDIYSEWQITVEYESDISIAQQYDPEDFGCTDPDATNYDSSAIIDDGSCISEAEVATILDIVNNCSFEAGETISCDGQYDLSTSSAAECPLYGESVTTSGLIVDYFDITPFNGPHSFTIQDADGNQVDFVVWPESSFYQDGFDITATDLNVLTQQPFGVYEVQITGELGAYCDDDEQLDISSEWQITVEYESDISFNFDESPVAVIGDDFIVDYGDTVTLDGTSSYAYGDGSIVGYYWNQESGTPVFYGEPEAPSISFTAPSEFTSLVFSLQVTDDSGATSVSYITVTVGEVGEVTVSEIINNCSFEAGETISCDGQYDLSTSSAEECPLYEQSLTTSGVIVDYFDITPFNGPHSFTIQDADGNQVDFVVWPESSSYQDGFDITATDLNVLTQQPFGVYEVQITGELGAYCDDDEQLDISSEWQITVEYESDIVVDGSVEECIADGDVTGDGIINVLDVISTVNHILGNSVLGDDSFCAADFNYDEVINVTDIIAIINIILED